MVVGLQRGGGQRVQKAIARMIDDVVAPRLDLTAAPPRERRWFEQPWLWGAVGVAVTAAVLLPFALDGGSDQGGFDVDVEGLP